MQADAGTSGTDHKETYEKGQAMRICTITCHDVYNAGASLQAYALQTYLKSLGHDVKIIDYKPDYLSQHYRLDVIGNPKYDKPLLKQAYLLAKLPGRLRMLPRKEAFDRFTAAHLDLIWNPLFPNGKDPAFYLDFVQRGTRAAYAASFSVDDFPEALRAATAGYLKRFDHVAVREKSGLAILRSLGIEGAISVLDPVFLLDRAQWETMAAQPEHCDVPYLLVYAFDNDATIRGLAERIAAERGLRIYSVFDLPYAERCFALDGPEVFLGLIQNAAFVLSNSFHATAFSVIFEKEFAVVERTEQLNSRMRDFTALLGLPERMVTAESTLPPDTDWAAVRCRLSADIDKSKAYIDKVLRDGEK